MESYSSSRSNEEWIQRQDCKFWTRTNVLESVEVYSIYVIIAIKRLYIPPYRLSTYNINK